jgi:hypothetical protein
MRKLFILSFSQIPNMPNQDKISLVTYCGLYCGLCAQRARIPQQAKQLEDTMHEEGYDFWYQYVPTFKETFPPFWQFLKQLAASDCTCKSGKGGPPDCKIRECAKKKKIATCPTCKEYPCEPNRKLLRMLPATDQRRKTHAKTKHRKMDRRTGTKSKTRLRLRRHTLQSTLTLVR